MKTAETRPFPPKAKAGLTNFRIFCITSKELPRKEDYLYKKMSVFFLGKKHVMSLGMNTREE